MLGAIAGDIIGSPYEFGPKAPDGFPLFKDGPKLMDRSRITDDTIMTVATAWALMTGKDFRAQYRAFGRRYPGRGYGGMFKEWLVDPKKGPYNSYGNGSAMRVSPVAFAYDDVKKVCEYAVKSAMPTHDHPEGVKGAVAVAMAVWMARRHAPKKEIAAAISGYFGYDLRAPIEEIRKTYKFDESCQGSVPQAIRAFLEADSFEGAVRLAVSLGGDADTQACIAGSIAHPYYGVPPDIAREVERRIPPALAGCIGLFCRVHRFGWEASGEPVRPFIGRRAPQPVRRRRGRR